VRHFRVVPARALRALLAVSFVVAAGCSGSNGSSTLPNGFGTCDSDAQSITIARPTPGFPANGNSIEIVSSSGSDQLHGNPTAFDLIVRDQTGQQQQFSTGFLSLVPDTGGPHPYSSDFYYQGNLNGNTLLAGHTYNVYLNVPSTQCTPGLVGQIFT
jgi:hypothetical protein